MTRTRHVDYRLLLLYYSRPYLVRSRLCYSVASVVSRRLSVSLSLCAGWIVAKRRVLEQKLLLTAYRKSYMKNRLVPKWMTRPLFRGRIKVMSTIALHLTLNISETVIDKRLGSKALPIENGIWDIKWSPDRWRHVTPKVLEAVRSAILATAWLLVYFLFMCRRLDRDNFSTF